VTIRSFSTPELISTVPLGDARSISRAITLAENNVPRARAIIPELYKQTGRAHVIGVTGSPGAGKSTLVDQLASILYDAGKKVAILAVDPSSPFSGGAVLGDRIRMNSCADRERIFIRSMATRGSLGGLCRAVNDALTILDAAGFDYVFIETVGVGQAEVDIVQVADSVAVVLVPGMGDGVQAFKAGILEIADLFLINKADREGVELLERDLLTLLSLSEVPADGWRVPVVRTVATNATGCSEAVTRLQEHQTWLSIPRGSSSEQIAPAAERRMRRARNAVTQLIQEAALERTLSRAPELLEQAVSRVVRREQDPFSAAQELVEK
jgi:LAO/AO transport system kinase